MKRPVLIAALTVLGTACAEGASDSDGSSDETSVPRFELVSSDAVEHGERLSHVLGCVGCHNLELTGEDWTEPEMGVLWTSNLTQSAAEYSHEELVAMITEGKRPDRALWDMPSFLFTEVHPADIDALVAYLKTLEPKGSVHPSPSVGPELQDQIDSGEWVDAAETIIKMRREAPPDMGSEHALGRHVVRATCIECHGMDLRGSSEPMADAPPRPDLRMVAAYSPEEFANFMETGKAVGDRELKLMSAVARYRYSRLTEREIEAMHDYLSQVARRDP